MDLLELIFSILAIFCMFVGVRLFMRFPRPAQKNYNWRDDPQVWNYHRKELARIHNDLGKTPREILNRYPGIERHELYEALQILCSWKSLNNLPLSELEEFVAVSTSLGMEVNNGGFHQYFSNSSGDDWSTMLEGMRKAGDDLGVERFEKILARFPRGQPSKVRAERWKQLDSFGDGQYEVFEEEQTAFFDDRFPDWDKIWEYVVAHVHDINPTEVK